MLDHIRQLLGGSEKGMLITPITANASSLHSQLSWFHYGMAGQISPWFALEPLDNKATTKGSESGNNGCHSSVVSWSVLVVSFLGLTHRKSFHIHVVKCVYVTGVRGEYETHTHTHTFPV